MDGNSNMLLLQEFYKWTMQPKDFSWTYNFSANDTDDVNRPEQAHWTTILFAQAGTCNWLSLFWSPKARLWTRKAEYCPCLGDLTFLLSALESTIQIPGTWLAKSSSPCTPDIYTFYFTLEHSCITMSC